MTRCDAEVVAIMVVEIWNDNNDRCQSQLRPCHRFNSQLPHWGARLSVTRNVIYSTTIKRPVAIQAHARAHIRFIATEWFCDTVSLLRWPLYIYTGTSPRRSVVDSLTYASSMTIPTSSGNPLGQCILREGSTYNNNDRCPVELWNVSACIRCCGLGNCKVDIWWESTALRPDHSLLSFLFPFVRSGGHTVMLSDGIVVFVFEAVQCRPLSKNRTNSYYRMAPSWIAVLNIKQEQMKLTAQLVICRSVYPFAAYTWLGESLTRTAKDDWFCRTHCLFMEK